MFRTDLAVQEGPYFYNEYMAWCLICIGGAPTQIYDPKCPVCDSLFLGLFPFCGNQVNNSKIVTGVKDVEFTEEFSYVAIFSQKAIP